MSDFPRSPASLLLVHSCEGEDLPASGGDRTDENNDDHGDDTGDDTDDADNQPREAPPTIAVRVEGRGGGGARWKRGRPSPQTAPSVGKSSFVRSVF